MQPPCSQQPACPWPQTARYPTLDWFPTRTTKTLPLCCATATPHRRCHDGGGTTHHESCHESCHESGLTCSSWARRPSVAQTGGNMQRWHAEQMQRASVWGAVRFRFQAQNCEVERGKTACLGLAAVGRRRGGGRSWGRMGLSSRHWPMAASTASATSWGDGASLHRLRHERE
jgi:hypothetical protein